MTIKLNPEPTGLLALAFTTILAASSVCYAKRLIQIPSDMHKTFARSGSLQSPDRRCKAKIQVNAEGGFLVLSVASPTARSPKTPDVTGIAWVGSETLVYTASPIYGKPGLFLLDCHSMQTKRVIGPRSITAAYPEGTDYFELAGTSGSSSKVFFYYSPDVDLTDFHTFRTAKNLCSLDTADLSHKSDNHKSSADCNAMVLPESP